MTLKSQANLSERSMSADGLSPTNPVYHVDMDSASQPVVKEVKISLIFMNWNFINNFC